MAEALALGVDLWTLKGMTPTAFGATFTGSKVWSVTVISTAASELANSVAVTCSPHFAPPYAVMPLGPPEMPLLMQKTDSTPSPGVWATNGYEIVVQLDRFHGAVHCGHRARGSEWSGASPGVRSNRRGRYVMSSMYVYAPVTGQVTSCWDFGAPVNCPPSATCGTTSTIYNATGWYCRAYCDQVCCHPSVTCSQPQDIGTGTAAPAIYFSADSVVQSIWIGYISNVCRAPCNYSPFTDGMNVYMYSGKGGSGVQLGVVSYCHVKNRAAAGFHDTYPYIYSGHANYLLGQVIDNGDCYPCFQGKHVHWERCGNSVANGSISCGDTMLTDLSWVFKYSY